MPSPTVAYESKPLKQTVCVPILHTGTCKCLLLLSESPLQALPAHAAAQVPWPQGRSADQPTAPSAPSTPMLGMPAMFQERLWKSSYSQPRPFPIAYFRNRGVLEIIKSDEVIFDYCNNYCPNREPKDNATWGEGSASDPPWRLQRALLGNNSLLNMIVKPLSL